jgi:hypothetical protein
MLDWKMLAASLVAIIFVASLLIGDFAIKGLFSGVGDGLGQWLGNSPFGGLFTAPTAQGTSASTISLKFRPDSFTIKPDSPVNMTFEWGDMKMFSGEIIVDYEGKTMLVRESNSQLGLTMPLQSVKIHGLKSKKLVIQNSVIDMTADRWIIASENGSVEVYDFSGTGYISSGVIALDGNITKFTRI